MNLDLIELFKVPILKINLNEDLNKLLKFSKNIFNKQKGRNCSNVGGFQSDNLNINDNVLNSLIKNITTNVNIFSNKYFFIKKPLSINNIWLNINGYKDYNTAHVHPFSKISGVFYVKTPKKCGDIIFINNSEIENFFQESFIKYNSYNSMKTSFLAKENTLYLFPSFVKHYVEQNLSKEKRISFSFNYN
jgi:uncharacterized protein (TIGR02466 family)